MLRTKELYSESTLAKYDELAIKRAQARLRRQAARLGYVLMPQKRPREELLFFRSRHGGGNPEAGRGFLDAGAFVVTDPVIQ
jgi:hypothetical protein